jgi:hypothetical protein
LQRCADSRPSRARQFCLQGTPSARHWESDIVELGESGARPPPAVRAGFAILHVCEHPAAATAVPASHRCRPRARHLLAAYTASGAGMAGAGAGGGRVAPNTLHAQSPAPLAVNSKLERNFIVHNVRSAARINKRNHRCQLCRQDPLPCQPAEHARAADHVAHALAVSSTPRPVCRACRHGQREDGAAQGTAPAREGDGPKTEGERAGQDGGDVSGLGSGQSGHRTKRARRQLR